MANISSTISSFNLCWLERKPDSSGWANSTCWQNSSWNIAASFSPDGRFLAYCSGESGASEVYVRSFPEGDRKWRISTNSGAQPAGDTTEANSFGWKAKR